MKNCDSCRLKTLCPISFIIHQCPYLNKNSSKDGLCHVVKSDEVAKLIQEGWEPMMTLPDGKVVMKNFR